MATNNKALQDFQEKCKQGRDRAKLLIHGQLGEDKELTDGLFWIIEDHRHAARKSKVPLRVRMPSLDNLFGVEEEEEEEKKKQVDVEKSAVAEKVRTANVRDLFEVEEKGKVDIPAVDEKLRINVGTLFSAAVKKAAKKPAPSNQETQRVEKLKAKYLRANIRNYSHKL